MNQQQTGHIYKPGDKIKLNGVPKRRLIFAPHSTLTILEIIAKPEISYLCINNNELCGPVKPIDLAVKYNPFKEADYFIKVLRSITNNTPFKGLRMLSIRDYCIIKEAHISIVYYAIRLGYIILCEKTKMIDWDKYGYLPFKQTKTKLKN